MKRLRIQVEDAEVSALWLAPPRAKAAYVLAHGAGAGMEHPSMAAIAEGLASRGVASLRFNFLYMERGSRRPDAPPLAHAVVRAAAAMAQELAPQLPLFAGGRSFGGRMSSQAQALGALATVRGLIFFAFPLHPAGKPGAGRAAHLAQIALPMLFLQGDRDALAELGLLESVLEGLKPRATLHLLEHADHNFHAPVRSGRRRGEALHEALDAASAWIDRFI